MVIKITSVKGIPWGLHFDYSRLELNYNKQEQVGHAHLLRRGRLPPVGKIFEFCRGYHIRLLTIDTRVWSPERQFFPCSSIKTLNFQPFY